MMMDILRSRWTTFVVLGIALALGVYVVVHALLGDGFQEGLAILAIVAVVASVRRLTARRTPISTRTMELVMGWGLVVGSAAIATGSLFFGIRADNSGQIAVGIIAAVFLPVIGFVVVRLQRRAR